MNTQDMDKRSKPAVLIVENSFDTTGAFNAILNYARYTQAFYSFTFVLSKESMLLEKVKEEGFAVETLPFFEISKHPTYLLLYVPMLLLNAIRLRRLTKRYQARIVHVNDFYNLTGAVAKMFGGHFVLLTHVRFMPDRFPSVLVKLWMLVNLKYSECIICVSQAVKRCLHDHDKIRVIYDGLVHPTVDTTSFKTREDGSHINLLYLAHYIPGKGQDFALEAFYKAFNQNPDLRLRFVGGDMGLSKNKAYLENLKKKATKLDIQRVVTFDGPTSCASNELAYASIALNFSESESFSMTCLEALVHGVPLCATDCGGPSELFEDGESGLLIPNGDIDGMSKAILKLASDPSLREKYARAGTAFVKDKFRISNTLAVMKDTYRKFL